MGGLPDLEDEYIDMPDLEEDEVVYVAAGGDNPLYTYMRGLPEEGIICGAGGPVPNTKWRAPKGVSYTLYWARGSRRINWARQGGCRQVSGSQGPLRPHNEYRHLGRNETSHSAGGTPGAVGSNDLDPGEAGAEKPGTPKGHCCEHTGT